MNRLSTEKRVQVASALVEGTSINAESSCLTVQRPILRTHTLFA